MTDKQELKPCPFCEGKSYEMAKGKYMHEDVPHLVLNHKGDCYLKHIMGVSTIHGFENMGKYNTRPIEDKLRKENKELQLQLDFLIGYSELDEFYEQFEEWKKDNQCQ